MTESIRKFMYALGNIIIIVTTPLLAIFIIIGVSFNITDASSDTGIGVLLAAVYGLFVYCFYRFMRKPTEGRWLPRIMVYIISLFISYLVFLLLAHLLWK